MMKKALKIVGIATGVIAILILIVLAFAGVKGGDIARDYVQKNDTALIGREIAIRNIDLSLFRGVLTIDSVAVKESNGQDEFVSFDTLYADISLFDLIRQKVTLNHIHLIGANANIEQDGNKFNFTDIIEHFSNKETDTIPKDTTPSAWEIGLFDIQLKRCGIRYADKKMKSEVETKDINIAIPGLYFSGKQTDIGLNLAFVNGGKLHATTQFDLDKGDFVINTEISDFAIDCIKPYMRQGVRVGTVSGLLDTKATMKGNFNDFMNFNLCGSSALKNVKITDDKDRMVVSINRTSAELKRLNLKENVIALGKVEGEGIASQFLIDKDGNDNITYFVSSPEAKENQQRRDSIKAELPDSVKEEIAAEKAQKGALMLTVETIDMRNMSMHLEDESGNAPFVYETNNVDVKAENFSLDKENDVNVTANIGKTGSANIRWRGSIDDMNNQNIIADIKNIDLTEFNPYFQQLFGYTITNGSLTLNSQNIIKDSHLHGINKSSIMNWTLEKDKSIANPEVKVPLKTALYVIKDKNGKIEIDLPIAGDINSPEFNYKKIVLKTFSNFLIKVGTSPMNALAKTFGNSEDINRIEYVATSNDLTPMAYDKLNKIAKMMQDKPELKGKITQKINKTKEKEELALLALKTDYYLSLHPDKSITSLEPIDNDSIMRISTKSKELEAFATNKAGEIRKGKTSELAVQIYGEQVTEKSKTLAEQRKNAVIAYLTRIMGDGNGQILVEEETIETKEDNIFLFELMEE